MLPVLGAAAVGGVVFAARWVPSSRRAVADAFSAWASGKGSLYDLMSDEAEVVIPGTAPHSGTFSKAAFIKDVATPFMSRFSRPPVPTLRRIWSDGDEVVVLADASGARRDGKAYANSYVFILQMSGARVVRATEFLDMAAFNAVWDEVSPAPSPEGAPQ